MGCPPVLPIPGIRSNAQNLINPIDLVNFIGQTWGKTWGGPCPLGTGSLILAGAGLLAGWAATINWPVHDELRRLGATPQRSRYMFDGKYVTAAGVSVGIDMALAARALT